MKPKRKKVEKFGSIFIVAQREKRKIIITQETKWNEKEKNFSVSKETSNKSWKLCIIMKTTATAFVHLQTKYFSWMPFMYTRIYWAAKASTTAAVATAAAAAAVVAFASAMALSHSRACNSNETNRCEQHPPISFSISLVSSDWFCVHNQWQTCWVGIRFVYNTFMSTRMRHTATMIVCVRKKITSRCLCVRLRFPCLRATKRTRCVCASVFDVFYRSLGLSRFAWFFCLLYLHAVYTKINFIREKRADRSVESTSN